MADRQGSEEPEEQIDLEGGDEDIVDEERRDTDEEELEEMEPETEYDHPPTKQDGGGIGAQLPDSAEGGAQDGASLPLDDEERKKWEELLAMPPHGTEVFVGGMPRDVTEEDLRVLCEPFGEIFEVKLVRDKESKECKGFAFVTFTTKDAAQRAIEDIHDKEFKGRTLRCSLSQTKHRLFVGNVPKNLSEGELRKMIQEGGPGIVNIEMFKDQQDPSRNRGFLFVEYYNNACADYSRLKMSSANFKVEGSSLTISWAEPKPQESAAASQVKTIYVKNLPEAVDKDQLKEVFERHGEITKIVLPPGRDGKKRDFGFVHFSERSSALKAVKDTEKYEIDGHALEVSLAKPLPEKRTDPPHGHTSGMMQNYASFPPYGGYGSFGGYGASVCPQPVIYGRGPAPSGMRMVPMVLPDGRVGYVLQQPHAPIAAPPRRGDRRMASGGGGRGSDGHRGRRYNPY